MEGEKEVQIFFINHKCVIVWKVTSHKSQLWCNLAFVQQYGTSNFLYGRVKLYQIWNSLIWQEEFISFMSCSL